MICIPLLLSFSIQAQHLHEFGVKIAKFSYRYENSKKDSLFVTREYTIVDSILTEGRILKGSLKINLNGDDALSQNRFQFGSELDMNIGNFPSELKFKYKSGLEFNNNKLFENFSQLFAAFDYHPAFGKENLLPMEVFGFAHRGTNNFMGVDLRYEIGGGVTFQYWQRNFVSNTAIENTLASDSSAKWTSLNKRQSQQLSKEDISSFINHKRIAYKSAIKQNARMRTGILLGIFYEFERIAFSDTISVGSEKQMYTHLFEPTNKIRYEIRPFFLYRIGKGVSFLAQTYFKMPFSSLQYDQPELGKAPYDIRIETEMGLSAKLQIPDVNNKEVEFKVTYNNYYDGAPNRFLTDLLDAEGERIVIQARRLHHMFNVHFGATF